MGTRRRSTILRQRKRRRRVGKEDDVLICGALSATTLASTAIYSATVEKSRQSAVDNAAKQRSGMSAHQDVANGRAPTPRHVGNGCIVVCRLHTLTARPPLRFGWTIKICIVMKSGTAGKKTITTQCRTVDTEIIRKRSEGNQDIALLYKRKLKIKRPVKCSRFCWLQKRDQNKYRCHRR